MAGLMDFFAGMGQQGTGDNTDVLGQMRQPMMQFGTQLLANSGPNTQPSHPLAAILQNSPQLAAALAQAFQRRNIAMGNRVPASPAPGMQPTFAPDTPWMPSYLSGSGGP